jgi:hypothetical protein
MLNMRPSYALGRKIVEVFTRLLLAIGALHALAGCTDPIEPAFVMPKSIEDARGRLLVGIPEGRKIAGARSWMSEHGFVCEPPMPSAADAHAHLCRASENAPADAGFRAWTIVLLERKGRLADVQVR